MISSGFAFHTKGCDSWLCSFMNRLMGRRPSERPLENAVDGLILWQVRLNRVEETNLMPVTLRFAADHRSVENIESRKGW